MQAAARARYRRAPSTPPSHVAASPTPRAHLLVTSMSEQPLTKVSSPRAYSSSGRNDLCDVNSPVTKWYPPTSILPAPLSNSTPANTQAPVSHGTIIVYNDCSVERTSQCRVESIR